MNVTVVIRVGVLLGALGDLGRPQLAWPARGNAGLEPQYPCAPSGAAGSRICRCPRWLSGLWFKDLAFRNLFRTPCKASALKVVLPVTKARRKVADSKMIEVQGNRYIDLGKQERRAVTPNLTPMVSF